MKLEWGIICACNVTAMQNCSVLQMYRGEALMYESVYKGGNAQMRKQDWNGISVFINGNIHMAHFHIRSDMAQPVIAPLQHTNGIQIKWMSSALAYEMSCPHVPVLYLCCIIRIIKQGINLHVIPYVLQAFLKGDLADLVCAYYYNNFIYTNMGIDFPLHFICCCLLTSYINYI